MLVVIERPARRRDRPRSQRSAHLADSDVIVRTREPRKLRPRQCARAEPSRPFAYPGHAVILTPRSRVPAHYDAIKRILFVEAVNIRVVKTGAR